MHRPHRLRVALGIALAALGLSAAPTAHADNAKRACVTASTDGQTLQKEDKLLEAREKLRICASDPCPSIVKTHCTRWLSDLEAQIPTGIVRARDAAGNDVLDAEVTIDGKPSALGRPEELEPGEHLVAAKRPSGVHAEKKFLLVDGEKGRLLTIDLPGSAAPAAPGSEASAASGATSSAPAAQGKSIPLGAWVLGGTGVLALGTSVVFALQTSNDFNTLKQCSPTCTEAQTAPGRTHASITDVSLGVGAAAVVGAIAWAILGRSDASAKPASGQATVDVKPIAGGAFGTVAVRF
jgi:hypothetical protein